MHHASSAAFAKAANEVGLDQFNKLQIFASSAWLQWPRLDTVQDIFVQARHETMYIKVSLLGVDSLWGDCTFIPADWGVIVIDLCYFAIFEDFSL